MGTRRVSSRPTLTLTLTPTPTPTPTRTRNAQPWEGAFGLLDASTGRFAPSAQPADDDGLFGSLVSAGQRYQPLSNPDPNPDLDSGTDH